MPPGDLYSPKRFAIGLSFASERRDFVRAVADELLKELRQADVLDDHFHLEEFAAPSLHLRLPDFYAKDCEVVVVFICHFYANKDWTKDEWRAVRDIVLSGDHDRVLFVKFEEADLPGLRKGDGYPP